jgi:hypothetical protein
MSTPNDGGPAFPHHETTSTGESFNEHHGMTLRDWFAGQALQAMVGVATEMSLKGIGPAPSPETIAYWAYCQSDAMLAVREESGGAQ